MDRTLFTEVSVGAVTKELRAASRSVRNRLQLILHDHAFVAAVAAAYQRPLVPNERCGLWYVPPDVRLETAYFKSTDGHTHEWAFSLRRLNLHLLPLITSHNGIILVDSTRRGKRIPDALAKTVPIWCAVLNYVMLGPHVTNWLHCAPGAVAPSEAAQIAALIPAFARRAAAMGILDRDALATALDATPLRPLWVYPDPANPHALPAAPPGRFAAFHPVVCCTASKRCPDGVEPHYSAPDATARDVEPHYSAPDATARDVAPWYYVQGAADDHELWAGPHLLPALFWAAHAANALDLDALGDDAILAAMAARAAAAETAGTAPSALALTITPLGTTGLSIGRLAADAPLSIGRLAADAPLAAFLVAVALSASATLTGTPTTPVMAYPLDASKKGARQFRHLLPQIVDRLQPHLANREPVLVVCDTGTDLSVGLLLVVLCRFYSLDTMAITGEVNEVVTKELVKKWLARVLGYVKVNPSRATLVAVHSYLM